MLKSKKIKEFETTVNNLQGHLKYSQSIVREKEETIKKLNQEICELESVIVKNLVGKAKQEDYREFI